MFTAINLLLSSLLLGIGYENFWPFTVLAIAIFLFIILKIRTFSRSFLFGWLFLSIYLAYITRWLFAVWPAEWMGLENEPIVLPLIFLIWLLLSAAMGIIGGIFAILIFIANTKLRSSEGRLVFVVPCAWIITEYLRAWFFSIFTAGQNALLGPHWTFGHLGYSLDNKFFLNLAAIFGVYGLSWIVVFWVLLWFF